MNKEKLLEIAKKNAAKIDKNFSKMIMKAKLQAIEAFRNSSQFDEEEEVVVKSKVTRNRRKKQIVEDEMTVTLKFLTPILIQRKEIILTMKLRFSMKAQKKW